MGFWGGFFGNNLKTSRCILSKAGLLQAFEDGENGLACITLHGGHISGNPRPQAGPKLNHSNFISIAANEQVRSANLRRINIG